MKRERKSLESHSLDVMQCARSPVVHRANVQWKALLASCTLHPLHKGDWELLSTQQPTHGWVQQPQLRAP